MSKLTELIKGRTAIFEEFHGDTLFYSIGDFRFPIPIKDLRGAKIGREEKASVFMKWIKLTLKEIEGGSSDE